MRKIKSWLVTATLGAAVFLSPAAVQAEKTVLKVGYIPGTGFLEEDWQGHLHGYGYEYMEFLSNYGEWTFVYIPSVTWQECNEKLQSGAIDLLPAMPGSYLSLKNVKRTDHVIGRLPMEIVAHEKTALPHMRLGNIPANPPLPSLPSVAQREGFTYEIVNFPLYYDMEEAFRAGLIDGYVAPMLKPNKPDHTLALFDRQSYRLLVRPDRTDLLAAMNAAMDQMLMDQPGIRDRLNDKYNRSHGSPLVLTRQEREYLAEKKKLRAAILTAERPYAFQIGDKWQGVIPSVIAEMAADLGVEIELVPTKGTEETEQMIKSGKIDFVADAICDFSWGKNFNMIPTQSYLHLEYVPVKRQGIKLDEDSRVACVDQLLFTKTFIASRYDVAHSVYYDDIASCFRAVSNGEADVLYAPRSEIQYLIDDTESYNLEAEPETVFTDTLSLGIYKNSDNRLWRIMNKEINHLDDNKIRSIINRGMESDKHMSFQWMIYHHPHQIFTVLLLIALLIGGIMWEKSNSRRRKLQQAQHIAYTNLRYNLPTLAWLEAILPEKKAQLREDNPNNTLYLALFYLEEKAANLSYGQNIYDNELKDFANRLKKAPWLLACSVGREPGELAALAHGKDATTFARDLQNFIRSNAYREAKNARLWLPLRVGISAHDPKRDFGAWVETAHAAILEAGRLHQDIYVFDEKLAETIQKAQKIVECRDSALENGEFVAWYQPILDLKTRKPVGAEALVRWDHPKMGLMLPESFVPIFELDDFIVAMDYYVLDLVCKLQKRRYHDGKEMIPVSLSQSHRHLSETDYLEKMKAKAKLYDLSPGMIDLEFAAADFSDLVHPERGERAKNILKGLKNLGYTVTLDYFSQASSLEALYSLPIDAVKLSPELLDQHNEEMLAGIVALGLERHIKVIALGVENKFQADRLKQAKCEYVQGFLYTKPLPEKEWLSSLG